MKNTKIKWTDSTFNPWRGCTKVSTGCANCYAESLAKRFPATLGIWGYNGTRVIASEAQWQEPLRWNRQAEKEGVRKRVFCASMADVFEDRPELVEPRRRLFDVIDKTRKGLDWLLLTKRPENIARLSPISMLPGNRLLDNVMWGTSVENQEQADKRIPELLKITGRHFLSCEPLLGSVDLKNFFFTDEHGNIVSYDNRDNNLATYRESPRDYVPTIDWVIVGGESGNKARPMHPDWVRSLQDQCKHAGVPFFFKQWGEYCPSLFENSQDKQFSPPGTFSKWIISSSTDRKESGKESFHAELSNGNFVVMKKVSKAKAGRELDGREWSEFYNG